MNNRLKNIPISLISTIAILLLFIVFINNVQITFGRYMSSVDGKVVFLFNAKQSFVLDCGEWEEVEGEETEGEETKGRQTLTFNISKSGNISQISKSGAVRIRLYMSQIDVIPSISISVNGKEYTSNISAIPAGTSAYKLYGAKNVCRFYGDAKKEACFDFSGTDILTATLILTADTQIDTSSIRIIAEPINT